MLKLTLLACLAVVAFGTTNHYIDYLYSTSAVAFPYPVGLCNRVSLLTASYKKFVCSTDKMSIAVSAYSDSSCTVQVGNTTTYTTSTGTGYGSWNCSGDNYYSSVEVYLGSCTSTPVAVSNYATDVCYLSSNGNYSIARCTDDMATIKSYASTSSDCTGTVLSTLTAETTCDLFTSFGALNIYAKLTSCEAEVDDAAYIPSVMGIIVFLVFNIVYLL